MKLILDEPNFSIIMPGGCNAKCNFCFYKYTPENELTQTDWLKKLKKTVSSLPKQFKEVSITGGEPTLNPSLLYKTTKLLRCRFNKIVLTTNGCKLLTIKPIIENNLIDFLNISRHHHTWEGNISVFKSNKRDIKTDTELTTMIERCHQAGIPTTINCVVTEILNVAKMIDYCKNIGAYALKFRTQSNEKPLYDLPINKILNNYLPLYKETIGDI